MYENQTPSTKFVSKALFVSAWWHWDELREINYDEAFSCPHCPKEQEKREFILDATSAGISLDAFVGWDDMPRDELFCKGS
jgi:hypothetical protein